MSCNLCLSFSIDSMNLMNIFSTEWKHFNIKQKIERLFWLEIISCSEHAYYLCRTCYEVITSFHELYLLVEKNHKEGLYSISNTKNSSQLINEGDSEIKFENLELNPQLQNEDFIINQESAPKFEGKRSSKRLVAQKIRENVETNDISINPPISYNSILNNEVKIKNEILNAVQLPVVSSGHKKYIECDLNSKNSNGVEKDDFLENNTLSIVTTNKNRKKLGRPNRSKPIKVTTTSSKKQTNKMKVSKEYDEFLDRNFKFSCCICQVSLRDFRSLKSHFRINHNTRGYVLCCGKKLIKRGVLVDHIRTHMDPEYFKCPKCNKVAASRRCLEVHMKLHEQKHVRSFKCEICSKSFFRRSVFMRHLLLHIPEQEKKVNCPQCEKTFATEYTMNQHLKLVHLNIYAKICDICGKSIRGRDAFQRHQLEHAGVPKPMVECEHCGMKLTNKYGLSRHIKVMHSEENLRPQVCSICSKISPSLSAYQRHYKYVHSMERKHACPMCEKAFKRANDLKEHMSTHTGEILYTCPHCPKTFNSNANMHSHRKKVHRKEWEEKRMKRFVNVKPPAIPNTTFSNDKETADVNKGIIDGEKVEEN